MDRDASDVRLRRRFRLQFGARALFIGFTILCLVIGWGSLRLYRNYRHDQAIAAIKEVGGRVLGEQDGQIDRVYLANPDIGDEKFEVLMRHLRYVRGMRELDLVNLPITDASTSQFFGFPELEQLYLFQTGLSDDGVAAVVDAMPHVEVRLEAPDPVASILASTNVYRHALVAMSLDPAGNKMVTGSGDGVLRWWKLADLTQANSVAAHDSWLFAAMFHPDGKRLVTAGGDDVVRVWDVATERKLDERRGHDDDVHAVGFSPDGQALYSASDDLTVRSWNFDDRGGPSRVIGRHEEQIPCLAVHPTTGDVLTGSRDDTIVWWDAERGESIRMLTNHESDVMALAFTRDGSMLASASYDGTVRLWDGDNGAPLAQLELHGDRVFHVAFDSTGRLLASCGVDGAVVWDVEQRLPLFQYREAEYASKVRFAREDAWLLVADAAGFIHIVDCLSGQQFRKITTARAFLSASR